MHTYEEKAVESLKPYQYNARTHSPEQVEKLKRSIQEFGFINPVLIDNKNMIIAGHGRVLAALELGIKKVPTLTISELTEDQVRAYIIADNKLAEDAGWDEELLQMELQALSDVGFDISIIGFDDDISTEDFEIDEDEYSVDIAEDRPPKTKLGEIYQLGDHRLMVGDSTKSEDVSKLMNGEKADLVVTDPPYNVAYEGGTAEAMTIKNDNMDDAKFQAFLTDAFANMNEALKEGGAFYIWHASRTHAEFENALNNNGLEERQQIIWNKSSLTIGRQDYQWKHEPCIYGWKEGAAHYFCNDRKKTTVQNVTSQDLKKKSKAELISIINELIEEIPSTVMDEKKPMRNSIHPTMKPISLFGRQIKNSSKPGEIVLDLFGGSGTTIMACEELDRKAYVMEYDPYYADAIIERWEHQTGKKAIKV